MGRLPTCTSRGLCAYQRVNAHVQGFAYKRHTTTDTTAPKTQTTSPTTPRLSAFFAEVVCTLGTTQPHVAASPPPNGGIARHEAPTRSCSATPHRHRRGGRRRDRRAWPRHRRDRRTWLRCAWAAGPGLPQKSHAIRLGEDSTSPKTLRFQRCEFRA